MQSVCTSRTKPRESRIDLEVAHDVRAVVVMIVQRHGLSISGGHSGGRTWSSRCEGQVMVRIAVPPPYALEHAILEGVAANRALCTLGDVRKLEIVQDAGEAKDLASRRH